MRGYLDFALQEVQQGISRGYRVDNSYCLLRAEYHHSQWELVIIAVEGDIITTTQAIVDFAKNNGFTSLRTHTKRRGKARYLRQHISPNIKDVFNPQDNEFILSLRF